MIRIFNPNKLTKQSFFQDLINYLSSHDEVTLRQIKQVFPDVVHVDRYIEAYIQSGYIKREQKRYYLTLPFLIELSGVGLEDMIFVDTTDPIYHKLLDLRFETTLKNLTNESVLLEETSISRDELTFSNYLHKLHHQEPLSENQMPLYCLLGDVNPNYALKYMTTFLLKFERREEVPKKRPDIFVQALEVLGYIRQTECGKYRLCMDFDRESLVFKAKKVDK